MPTEDDEPAEVPPTLAKEDVQKLRRLREYLQLRKPWRSEGQKAMNTKSTQRLQRLEREIATQWCYRVYERMHPDTNPFQVLIVGPQKMSLIRSTTIRLTEPQYVYYKAFRNKHLHHADEEVGDVFAIEQVVPGGYENPYKGKGYPWRAKWRSNYTPTMANHIMHMFYDVPISN